METSSLTSRIFLAAGARSRSDVFIHELGHALNLPHWGEGPFGNSNANMYEYNYPYGGALNDGGGRGESWTFNQDLYEFINPNLLNKKWF